jgi:hypothetical protein
MPHGKGKQNYKGTKAQYEQATKKETSKKSISKKK